MSDQSTIQPYTPSELLTLFSNFLNRQEEFTQIIYLQGIYQQKPYNPRWAACYDSIRDEKTSAEMTVRMTKEQHDSLSNGNLIVVGGVLGKQMRENGNIQVFLSVTRVDKLKEQVVDEAEVKRAAIIQQKSQLGYQNVDSLLERVLYQGDRKPKVALVFAETSITDQDFKAGIQAAQQAIDFNFNGFTFTRIPEFIHKLELLDTSSFDLICLVRGGGSGISEVFDNTDLAEAIIRMKTPVLSAIGHQVDNPLVCKVADKNIGTPSLLGQYFKDMVERIAEEKNHSKAALVDQVKKQFAEQINTLQKQLTEQSKGFLDQRAKDATEMEKLRNQVKNVAQAEKAKQKKLVVVVVVLSVILVSMAVLFLLSNNK